LQILQSANFFLLRCDDMEAVIPLREGTSGYAEHDREKYKWRHLVENFFCSIKAFRRIATRYEKTDRSFAAIINLVGGRLDRFIGSFTDDGTIHVWAFGQLKSKGPMQKAAGI
jgi:hypothetical protein